MYKGQVFKQKKCLMCRLHYTPNSSIQKYCKKCSVIRRKEYKSEWRRKNKDRDNATKKEWYWNNLEKVRAIKRKWNNSDNGIKYRKAYFSNPEYKKIINNRSKKYRTVQKNRIAARKLYTEAHKVRCDNHESFIFVCSRCGASEGKMEVHHIDFNTSNNNLDNLTSLCLKCHKYLHRQKRLQSDQNHIS